MPTRLYFDLKAVTDLARHAILADRNLRTPKEAAALRYVPAEPALWFFRFAVRVRLEGNGNRWDSRPSFVYAQPEDALTTPVVRPPDADNPAVLPLLDPDGQSLFDLLCDGLAAGHQWAVLDPSTLTLGVGRRRIRGGSRTPATTAQPRRGGPRPVRRLTAVAG